MFSFSGLVDLKLQLANCEETNLQLVSDLDESQRRRESDVTRIEKELSARVRSLLDETEMLKRTGESSRVRVSDLSAECAFLSTNLKDALGKIELYEQQFAGLQAQAQCDSLEMRKLTHELNAERVRHIYMHSFSNP